MTAADKFGIAFSMGVAVAFIAIAMSLSAISVSTPAQTMTPPAPQAVPAAEEPAMEETPAAEEPAMEETPAAEELPASTQVSIPAGSSTPGCEENGECYIPNTVTIGVGGTVTWTNDDTAAHTVTSGTASDGPDGTFDSSIFMQGSTFEYTFDEAGTFDYFCVVHPWMTGTVIVE